MTKNTEKKVENKKSNCDNFHKNLSVGLFILVVILGFVFINLLSPSSINMTVNNDDNNNNVNLDTNSDNQNSNLGDMNSISLKGGDKVLFETSYGNFEIQLFLDESPITAGNFKKLVESGFYDGQRFHRVIKNFMIQGGDPNSANLSKQNAWGTGNSGTIIEDEFISGLSNVRGTLSMANSGPHSGSSQFFINVADNTFLDFDKKPSTSKHPVFGKIISGMDIIDKISNTNTLARDIPEKEVLVTKASIIN